jgi:hypothetical protein
LIDPRRVACRSGAYSMLHFRFEMGGDKTKRYQKMKWRQRAHLGSMRIKCDLARRRDVVDRRRGDTGEGKGRR